jgi:Tol biopolymer transport system component
VGPSWSRDGEWIYFDSTSGRTTQVWKLPIADGNAVQVTKRGGCFPLESTDGKTVYYLKDREPFTSLWKVAAEGGEERQVLESVFAENYAVVPRGIYFMPAGSGRFTVQFFSFATTKITQIASIEKDPMWGLSVSPDERWILYPQVDQNRVDLILVENFR